MNIKLISRGRFDIAPEAFADEKPVYLDVGVVVECLKVTTKENTGS